MPMHYQITPRVLRALEPRDEKERENTTQKKDKKFACEAAGAKKCMNVLQARREIYIARGINATPLGLINWDSGDARWLCFVQLAHGRYAINEIASLAMFGKRDLGGRFARTSFCSSLAVLFSSRV